MAPYAPTSSLVPPPSTSPESSQKPQNVDNNEWLLIQQDLAGPVDAPYRRNAQLDPFGVYDNHDSCGECAAKNDQDEEAMPWHLYLWKKLGPLAVVVAILAVYLYLAMAMSTMYLLGLIAALGVGMMVQGHMRQWSVRQVQALYIYNNNDNDNLADETQISSTDVFVNHQNNIQVHPDTCIMSTPGLVIDRYTDGWDPGRMAAAAASCHNPIQQHVPPQDDLLPSVVPPQEQSQATSVYDYAAHGEDYHALTTVGSVHTLVVQYEAFAPQGWQVVLGGAGSDEGNEHVVQTSAVTCTIIKKFRQVHPDLFYPDEDIDNDKNDNAGSANNQHVLEVVYQAHNPRSGLLRAAWQAPYVPKHQGGRVVLGGMVICLAVGMSAFTLPWTLVDLVALGVNCLLWIFVAKVVYDRQVQKHEALLEGHNGGTTRIVGWNTRTEEEPKQNQQLKTTGRYSPPCPVLPKVANVSANTSGPRFLATTT